MNNKRFSFKFLAFLVVLSFGYIQSVEAIHTPHSFSTYSENDQVNTQEVSCSICFFIQHAQYQNYCIFKTDAKLLYSPAALDLEYNYLSHYAFIGSFRKKSRSPPSTTI